MSAEERVQPLVVGRRHDATTVVGLLAGAPCEHALLVREGDGLAVPPRELLDLLGARFRGSPGLSAVALAPSERPFAATLPLLAAHLPEEQLWPAALAVRVSDVLAVAGGMSGATDPLVAIAERLEVAGAGIEWRGCSSTARPRAAAVHGDSRPGVDAPPISHLPAAPAPPAPTRDHEGWVCIERIATPEGGRRVARAAGALGPGEFRERSLCLVRADGFPGHIELIVSVDGHGDHPIANNADTVTLGFLHRVGLPGSVHLSVFHDPERGDDFVGLTGEHFPGCHRSRPLGWALSFPSTVAPLPPRLPVDRVRLCHDGGDWFSEPATPGSMERPDPRCVALLHRDWAPGRIPLFRSATGSRSRLTVDPFNERATDQRVLGYASRAQKPRLARLCISSAGEVTLARSGDALPAAGDVPPVFVEAAPDGVARSRQRPPDRPPAATLRGRAGALRRRLRRRQGGRVLIVAPWFSVGGGDNFLLALIRVLRSQGVPVSAVLTFHKESSPVDNRAAFTPDLDHLICLPEARPGTPIGTALAEAVRDLDVNQLFLCGAPQVYPHLPALKAAFPWIRVVDQLFNDVGHLAQNTTYSSAIDLTVCAYRGLQDLLVGGQGRDPSRVALAYIGIDTRVFHPGTTDQRRAAKASLGLDPDREVWGYLGRISEEKSLHNLVEAAARLSGCCDAQFLIQGEGPARAQVDAIVASRAPGIATRPFADDVGHALRALDVYVLPSRTEGIPLGVMEAMASGVLPIATSVGGLPEVITPGVSGYLVSPGDPGAIAVGLLAAARTSSAAREEMAQAARARIVSEMSLEAMRDRYLEILT